MSARTRLLVGSIGLAALVAVGSFLFRPPERPAGTDVVHVARTFQSSHECRECHQDVWDEWYGSHHQIAYLNPEVRKTSEDFRNKACQACHLPQPVAVTGFAERTLPRTTRPEEGVDCITCHVGVHGEILGPRSLPSVECAPIGSAELLSIAQCESCHNQHWTTDQWRASPWSESGVSCNDCHMPAIERTAADGTQRWGRHHGFVASHDPEMVRSACRFTARWDGDELVVSLTNVFAGHAFPTEERSRAADIRYRFDGVDPEDVWHDAWRFRMPYRDEPLPDTQLPAGETKTVTIPVPEGATTAHVRLWYRTQPYVGDDHPASTLLHDFALEASGAEQSYEPEPPMRPLPEGARPPLEATAAPTTAARPAELDGLPPLPDVTLEPMLPEFERIAANAPPVPSESERAELRDLIETAWLGGYADARTAELAKRALADHPHAARGWELALEHEDAAIRARSAFELGERRERAALPLLVLRLKYEKEPSVLVWVVDALGKLDCLGGIDTLVDVLSRPDLGEALATEAAARAFELLARNGRSAGEAPIWEDIRRALRALADTWDATGVAPSAAQQEGALAEDPLLAARLAQHMIALNDTQLRPVDDARFVFRRLGHAGLPMLERALRAEEHYVRSHGLEVVTDLGTAAAPLTEDVLALLDIGDPRTLPHAIRTLGTLESRDAVPYLRALLKSRVVERRAAAAGALGPIGDASVYADLQALVADPNEAIDVRVQAASSLAMLDPGVRFLRETLESGGYHEPTLRELLDAARGR